MTGASGRPSSSSPPSHLPDGVAAEDGGQDEDMRRRITPEPEDVDLRDPRDQDDTEQQGAVANPRRTRR